MLGSVAALLIHRSTVLKQGLKERLRMPQKAVCVLNGEVVKGTLFFDQNVSFVLCNNCA